LPTDVQLRRYTPPANKACRANVDVEPDGAATQIVGEDAAPPARPMDRQSPLRRSQLQLQSRPQHFTCRCIGLPPPLCCRDRELSSVRLRPLRRTHQGFFSYALTPPSIKYPQQQCIWAHVLDSHATQCSHADFLALRKYSTLALRHMLALRHKLALRLKLALRHKLARRHELALRRKLVTANTSYPECWP
jgi:hypothetical protein